MSRTDKYHAQLDREDRKHDAIAETAAALADNPHPDPTLQAALLLLLRQLNKRK